jgi:hypothetical protein
MFKFLWHPWKVSTAPQGAAARLLGTTALDPINRKPFGCQRRFGVMKIKRFDPVV